MSAQRRPARSNSSRGGEMVTPKAIRECEASDHGKPGAKGESDAARKAPAAPSDDDPSPVGDTDQHSTADA